MKNVTPESIQSFRHTVYEYYRKHYRPFPWRLTRDSYEILVSEVMLQQTQTYRVLPKYEAFLQKFPTVDALASASLQEVLAQWQGLGYNRRGQNLKRAAEVVVRDYHGKMPTSSKEFEKLPGVGPYTAAAVATFAYDQPLVFIETNIRTVFLHHFFEGQYEVSDAEIMPLIEYALDRGNPRDWYYALMDYGVMLKKVYPNPNRRSKHYAQQSKFEGSDRQIRGAIIRLLTKQDALLHAELLEQLGKDEARVCGILEKLVNDGLIVQHKDRWRIA